MCRLQVRLNNAAASHTQLEASYAAAVKQLTQATAQNAIEHADWPQSWYKLLLACAQTDAAAQPIAHSQPAQQSNSGQDATSEAASCPSLAGTQLCLSMAATYSATTMHCLMQHASRLSDQEHVAVHWAGASIGEVDSLATVEACLLHQLPRCKVRPVPFSADMFICTAWWLAAPAEPESNQQSPTSLPHTLRA